MIPKADIVAWRQVAPWVSDAQVEQDLIISRALVSIFKDTFIVNTRWFKGECGIATFELEELLATKLRALYQRRKGRDLFDLWYGLSEGKADAENIVKIFKEYMKAEGHRIKKEDYEKNIEAKMKHRGFIDDVKPLLPADMKYDVKSAFSLIGEQLVPHI